MRRLSAVVIASMLSVMIAVTALPVSAKSQQAHTPTLAQCQVLAHKAVKVAGRLTLATSDQSLSPWFVNDNPANGQGFESALAYLLAHELGFATKNVAWLAVPWAQSYSAGAKPFDFDINEIVVTPARAANVSFTSSYYDLQQSLVAMKNSAVIKHHLPSDLIHYTFGALAKSASLTYITTHIKPLKAPKVFSSPAAVVAALKSGAINAFVIDTPTGNVYVNYYLLNASAETSSAVQVGQFPAVGDLYYAMSLQKGSALTACLNVALNTAKASGALRALKTRWLGTYNAVPLIRP
jgi:polar amino acid transport system substrate-binding protein